MAQLSDFERNKFRIVKFLCQKVAKNMERFFFFLFSYLVRSQIWLNDFLDDYHLGCFTKSLKETQLGIITGWQFESSSPSGMADYVIFVTTLYNIIFQ
jgi:hypothetical protein